MDNILWIFYGAIGTMAWGYVLATGGPQARAVVTLGALAYHRPAPHPRRTGPPRWTDLVKPARAVGSAPVLYLPRTTYVPGVLDELPTAEVVVQRAVPLRLDDDARWDDFEAGLLATLSAGAERIRLDGWGAGQWCAVPSVSREIRAAA